MVSWQLGRTLARASAWLGLAALRGRLEVADPSRRVQALPDNARTLLLVAAAGQTSGDASLTWRAAEQLGINPEAAVVPGAERLLTLAPRIEFRYRDHFVRRHITLRAVPERRRAHEALAAVIDPVRDPDRRAWHLAEAATGLNEQVAAQLERSAERARSRGGWASDAAFLERSAELTPDRGRRAQRRLAAARAMHLAAKP